MQFKLIFDTFHGNIELSNFESVLLRSPVINRLHQILQNSTAYLVFPSTKTARFEHSIGVMNHTSNIFINGIKNSDSVKDFITDKKKLIKILLRERNDKVFKTFTGNGGVDSDKYKHLILEHFNVPSFENLIDKKEILEELFQIVGKGFLLRNQVSCLNDNSGTDFTLFVLFQAIRMYGLLHDIGHLPFSHLFEFSIENVFEKLISLKTPNPSEKKVIGLLTNILKIGIESTDYQRDQIHEIIGKKITKYILADIKNEIYQNEEINEITTAKRVFVLDCIELCWEEIIKGKESRLFSLYNIVSGVIDSDRLDYIQRDGASSGVNKATGNIDRIIKLFCLIKVPKEPRTSNDDFLFMPSIQSLHDVEKILYDRFNIYKYMVNHHAVKRSDYIFQKAIENEFLVELNNKEEFSDSIKVEKLIDTIKIIHDLVQSDDLSKYKQYIYKFTQISDFWLYSLFTAKYFQNIFEEDSINSNLLSEIFENSRNFRSLWKREYDYRQFIEGIASKLFKNSNAVLNRNDNKFELNEKPVFNKLKKSIKNKEDYYTIGSIVITFLKTRYQKQWCNKIEDELNKKSPENQFLLVETKMSIGIKDTLWLVDIKDQTSTFEFEKVSNLKKMLEEEVKSAISFFAYFCPSNKVKSTSESESDSIKSLIQDSILEIFLKNNI